MKYQIVQTKPDGTERILDQTFTTADFATQVCEAVRDWDPKSSFRVETVSE